MAKYSKLSNYDEPYYDNNHKITRFYQQKYYILFPILHYKKYQSLIKFRYFVNMYQTNNKRKLLDLFSKHRIVFSYDEIVAINSKCWLNDQKFDFIDDSFFNHLNIYEIIEQLGDNDYIDIKTKSPYHQFYDQ